MRGVVQEYTAAVERFRKEKDRAFREEGWSPVPAEEQEGFGGLSYYPVDPRYRFLVALEREPPERMEIPMSTGGVQVQERVGRFHLALPEGPVALAAFRSTAQDDHLFLPFRDATSGKETYGGGRYLDVRAYGDGRFVVDLNFAYHPYCVYNEDYACPMPPPENRLEVPVRVGERLPP